MRELDSSLQQFGELLLKAQLARPAAAPYFVRWVRRFLAYAAQQQGVPHPRVESAVVRNYLTHVAVHQRVSASTPNCQPILARASCGGITSATPSFKRQ